MPEETSSPVPPPPPPFAQPGPFLYGGFPRYAPIRSHRSAWFYIGVLGGIFAALLLLLMAMTWSTVRALNGEPEAMGGFGARSRIAVIDISGVIQDPDALDAQLRKFGEDRSVKAILLRIDSPGGGAAASQEIYHEVLRVRNQQHKKVVASIASVGASGAYYIASGCDRIYANQASVVGSIGVIMEWTNYGDLLRWAKLKNIVIHAGELKDAGDPTRDLTPQEQAYFQSLVDNMYGQFVHDVAAGRHTTEDKIRPLATGQVWTGQQAVPLGLVDQIGDFQTALIDTARSVGIRGEPSIVRPASEKKGLLAALRGDAGDLFPDPSQLLNRSPGFYFMWK